MLTTARVEVSTVQVPIGVEVEEVATAGARLQVAIVDAVGDLRPRAGGEVDEGDVGGGTADRPVHRIGRPAGHVGELLPLERRDLLGRRLRQLHHRVGGEVPGAEQVALAVGPDAELLPGDDVDVAGVPDVDGGLLVTVSPGGRLVFLLRLRRVLRVPPSHADEHDGAVIGPRGAAEGHGAQARRKRCAGGRVEQDPRRGGARRPAPGEQHLGRPFVALVGLAAQDGEVVALAAPGQAGVERAVGIEHAQGGRGRVIELDAVSGLVLGIDCKGEPRALVLPDELRHVPEGSVAAGGEVADDQRGAGGDRRFVVRRGRSRILALGGVTPHGEVGAGRVEGERLDRVERGGFPRCEIQQPHLPLDRLLLLPQLLFLRLRVADRIGEPFRVRGEGGGAAERRRRRRLVRHPGDPQLVVAAGTVDAVGDPLPVRGQAAARLRRQGLPLTVVGGAGRELRLRAHGQRGGGRGDEGQNNGGSAGPAHLAHLPSVAGGKILLTSCPE